MRLVPAVLALMMLCGCSGNGSQLDWFLQMNSEASSSAPSSEPQRITTLRLPYDPNDTLNPYNCASETNRRLSTLLYDSLIRLGPDYSLQQGLAQEAVVNGSACTIRLRDGITFWDGSAVTPEDVVYSLQTALSNLSVYSALAASIDSYKIQDDGSILIQLKAADINFANLLTFPVVKEKTALDATPVGSGRYRLITSNGSVALEQNQAHYGEKGNIKTIQLLASPDNDALIYSLKIGTIDYSFVDADSTEYYSVGTSSKPVGENQIVYVGMSAKGPLANAGFKHALNLLIDRETITSRVYAGRGRAAYTPFNPSFSPVSQLDATKKQDVGGAKKLLEESGFTERDAEGFLTANKKRITLRILVNTDNALRLQVAQFVKENLALAGIDSVIVEQPFESYVDIINKSEFDLYIGEMRVADNMDIAPLLVSTGAGGSGLYTTQELLADYLQLRAGSITYVDFIGKFFENPVFIPLLYTNGEVAYQRGINIDVTATETDIFYNIQQW